MGLNDLVPDDAGKAKGGRPKEGGKEARIVPEHIYRPWKHRDEYWEKVWEEHVESDEPTLEEITDMVGYSGVFPWDLKIHLEAAEVYEFDWDHMPDDYPSDDALANWLRNKGVINDFTKKHPPEKSKTPTFGSKKSEETSGLMGLVENAKE